MANLTGQTLGRYQLIERLGRGGMAEVYKAYQPNLDRYVAVKVLHSHLSEEPGFITRFEREAKAVAHLRHPHIIQIHDSDVQEGYYFFVMEYVEGGWTLKEMLQDMSAHAQRLPLVHTLDITAKVADALDYAHRQGMVHRDIKPSNILMPHVDCPILTDFGIARLIGQTGLTASGAMIGTPAYMSPEQGRGEPADERSDIYALGIVLYEMLTGRPPYDADTPYGVILKHINDPLVPPHVLVGLLPDSVERITLKSLAKDPSDRYETAGHMRDALVNALDHLADETAVSHPTSPLDIAASPAAPAAPTEVGPIRYEVETLPVPLVDEPRPGAERVAVPEVVGRMPRWWLWAVGVLAALVLIAGAVALLSRPAGEEVDGIAGTAPTARSQPTSTPRPEPTALPPIEQPLPGDRLEVRANGIHICRGEDRCTPISLLDEPSSYGALTWSPDGTRFAFTACPVEQAGSAACTAYSGLYISDREGSVSTLIPSAPFGFSTLNVVVPSWAPDGELIAFHGSGGLWVIRPDGSGSQLLVEGSDTTCPMSITWSPDSEQIAWVGGNCAPGVEGTATHVWAVRRDGSYKHVLFHVEAPQVLGTLAWSPDGGTLAVLLNDEDTYLIDVAECDRPGGCDLPLLTSRVDFPWDWADFVFSP